MSNRLSLHSGLSGKYPLGVGFEAVIVILFTGYVIVKFALDTNKIHVFDKETQNAIVH